MKEQIMNWLKYDRSYNAGVAIYQKYGNSMSIKTTFNRQGETTLNMGLLVEELRKLAEIPQDVLSHIMSKTVNQYRKQIPEIKVKLIEEPVTEPVAPLIETIQELKANLPGKAIKAIRLRDEFPFLSQADCPPELKILVADMLTAYDAYKASHAALFTVENEEELLSFAKGTVENYLENRSIWDELNHYKESGTILGKHPIFAQLKEMSEIQTMSASQLGTKKGNLRSSISKLKKSVDKADKPEMDHDRNLLIASKETLLAEVERLLSIR